VPLDPLLQRLLAAVRALQDDLMGKKAVGTPEWRPSAPFLLSVGLREPHIADKEEPDYSVTIPAISDLLKHTLDLTSPVTFLVGENGSGKSTLIEALAVAAGFNAEGGGKRLRFTYRASHSNLHRFLSVSRAELPPANGFFLRAESFFNFATHAEHDPFEDLYERSLHEQSHGESFLSLTLERFGERGLYVLDEPEAALSLRGQLGLIRRMRDLAEQHCQLIVATHSPILLAYPDARIYELGPDGIAETAYEDTEPYHLTRSFLESPERFLRHLFAAD
jgi:predicted ATPase